jgi:transcription elongation factor Elf1
MSVHDEADEVFAASELKAQQERAEARRDPRQRALFPASFVCPRCGAESFNANDVANRYCGRCHVFVGD